MQGYCDKPTLSMPIAYDESWVCKKTGIVIPKAPAANEVWREKLLTDAAADVGFRRDLLAACRESVYVWMNAFCWTYHQREIDPETGVDRQAEVADHPFVTWPVQDEVLKEFIVAFDKGRDVLVSKSREMGASWLCLGFLHWLWLFRPSTEIREMSRNEALVDGDADSLMWKHDYINSFLPPWMQPPGVLRRGRQNRTKLHLVNETNGSTIAGAATTSVALSGGRAAVLFLDEFAKVPNGAEIRSSTTDVAVCRIINSTPFGAGTEYSRWKNSGAIKVVPLMFYNHPQKGYKRYLTRDDIGRYHIRSPWFDNTCKKRSPREVAQEVLAEDLESGDTTFIISNINKHIAMFTKPPNTRLNVALKAAISDANVNTEISKYLQSARGGAANLTAIHYCQAAKGKLHVWDNLVYGRPDQSRQYIFGIDVSRGQGASESVVSIKCKDTQTKIARWADSMSPPYEFARTVIALALWCGGANPTRLPFLKWEQNGSAGWDLGRMLVKVFQYPFYYSCEPVGTTGAASKSDKKKYGWHSSRQAKAELMALYDRLLAHGGYINPDERALQQAQTYVNYPGGGCGPAELVRESEDARAVHGDIVIADALTLEDDRLPKPKRGSITAPWNTPAYRKEQIMKRRRQNTLNKNSWIEDLKI